MKTYKYYTALIIAMAMSSCMVFAQAPVRRNTTTNRTTSTPSRKPTQRQTKPATNATPPKQTASQPKRSQPSGYVNGHMAVDLGLSVRWADCNVGATSPEQFGSLFTIGDPYCQNTECDEALFPKKNYTKTQNDMAYVNWGGNWHLPTTAEIEELVLKCTWREISQNGIKGCLVTGVNGNSIFLPYTGRARKGEERTAYSGYSGFDVVEGSYWSGEKTALGGFVFLSFYKCTDGSIKKDVWSSVLQSFRMSVRAVTE